MEKHVDRTPQTIFLKDYRPPDYLIDTVNLHIDLGESSTIVQSLLTVHCNPDGRKDLPPLVLQGRELKLRALSLNGQPLSEKDYRLDDESLTIMSPTERFILEIETECNPADNTELSGLYRSEGMLLTQCEADGFRKITYYPDRPDVLARFFTTLVADRQKYPILLANGNPLGQGELEEGKHFAKWHDPFPKPAYLFALAAGDLACQEDRFVTMSGREVILRIFVQPHNLDKCGHAMDSLKKAMTWDEEAYGREYDLEMFMIVATDDFNMGAMENKGLNIFNSKYVLANSETATDSDFQSIMGVVSHEYFHNWSGNRVTCRDWFQLSLKEGFTVFRDQHFMEDMTSFGVKRISDVNILRTHQFREDSGPLAHPVRPESYVEINNFYTLTVYNKGAEVIRMLRTILGPQVFRRGSDLYFQRHDGQAVTTDDFVKALEDASGMDLTQFKRWYFQAGTPELQIGRFYDPLARTYTLTMKQTCPPTPGQPEKEPLHIPVAIGLLDKNGRPVPLQLLGEEEASVDSRVLHLQKEAERFVFINLPEEPVPSVLRGFSAPVKAKLDLTDEERLFLIAHDTDEFNRWDAGQQYALVLMLELVRKYQEGTPLALDNRFIEAFRETLDAAMPDRAFKALILSLPSEAYLADAMAVVDPEAIHEVREFMRQTLATALKEAFLTVYQANREEGPYRLDQESIGMRSLKNTCLGYLMTLEDQDVRQVCMMQFQRGGNMTDVLAALTNLVNFEGRESEEALSQFYEKWRGDPLVVDKWLMLQAGSQLPDTLNRVRVLMDHQAFTIRNPNKVRALIGAFAANPLRFHAPDGGGYAFLTDQVLRIDPLNPQIAARLASAFTIWKRYDERRQRLMHIQLERILAMPKLSRDVYEIVSKTLA